SGSPTSRLPWQPCTWPMLPHSFVRFTPLGSSIHSPTSWVMIETSLGEKGKTSPLSYIELPYDWNVEPLPFALWYPRMQQFDVTVSYITTLPNKKSGKSLS